MDTISIQDMPVHRATPAMRRALYRFGVPKELAASMTYAEAYAMLRVLTRVAERIRAGAELAAALEETLG